MMKNFIKYVILPAAFFQCSIVFSQLAVNNNYPYNSAQYLVQNVLTGAGMTTSNITFTGDPKQIGFFDGVTSSLGADSGIVLATDDIIDLTPGGFASGITGIGTDNDLLTIANSVPPLIGQSFSVSSINDKSILEFDFIPFCDTMRFEYVFGSDEYLTYINSSYNDVFAFFVSGPGISGPYQSPPGFPDGAINIAFVPNSSPELPITVSSVNPNVNSQYYIDNSGNTTVGLNGFTTVMTAEAVVTPGETYHMKLAIADGSDGALASAVFLNAGSFGTNGNELSLNLTSADVTCNGACNGSATVAVQDSASYLWSNGQTDSVITGLCAGTYSVTVTNGSNACPSIGSVNISEPDSGGVNILKSDASCFGSCNGSAAAVFQDSAIYLWSNGQTDSVANGLCAGEYSVTITSSDSICTVIGTVTISDPGEISIDMFSIVDSGNYNGAVKAIVSGGTPPYSYLWSDSMQQTVFNPSGLPAGIYFVTVTDSSGCTAIDSIEIPLYIGEEELPVSGYGLKVYPNPNDGKFSISGGPAMALPSTLKVSIYNTLGEIIYSTSLSFPGKDMTGDDIDISVFPIGVYCLRLNFENGSEDYIKFVKYD